MSTDDFDSLDTLTSEEDELLAGLHRSVAGARMAADAADVVALGRRTRNRHRAVAAGIGTTALAIVAAVGMPASSPHSSGGQLLNIQDAGFTLEEHADGTVALSVRDAFDPAKLHAALDRAGIPSAILVRQIPDGWDLNWGIDCTPDPGVHPAGAEAVGALRAGESNVAIYKSKIPAGDFLTLYRFERPGQTPVGWLGLNVGRQRTCVPEYLAHGGPPAKPGK